MLHVIKVKSNIRHGRLWNSSISAEIFLALCVGSGTEVQSAEVCCLFSVAKKEEAQRLRLRFTVTVVLWGGMNEQMNQSINVLTSYHRFFT